MISKQNQFLFLRTILDDKNSWFKYKRKNDCIIIANQRYIKIRKIKEDFSTEYISTKAIHELMILFRRIEKLYKDGIIKKIDLVDIWREILPFGVSGRPEFFTSYLSDNDTKSMRYVILMTLCASKKYKNTDALNYFNSNKNDHSNFKTNKRYRLRDILDLWIYNPF